MYMPKEIPGGALVNTPCGRDSASGLPGVQEYLPVALLRTRTGRTEEGGSTRHLTGLPTRTDGAKPNFRSALCWQWGSTWARAAFSDAASPESPAHRYVNIVKIT